MQDMPVEHVSPISGDILKSMCYRIALPQVTGTKKKGKKTRNSNKKDNDNNSSKKVMLSEEVTSQILATMMVEVKAEYIDAVKYGELIYMINR